MISKFIRNGFAATVGRTPLIYIKSVSKETGCTILAKAEHCNPGGSVKDRAALYLVKDAIQKGTLKEGGTIVEGTAGNTGIGLVHIANSLGYKTVIFMPDNQSQAKVDALRVLGAVVHVVPAVPYANENNYNHQAKRFAESNENCAWMNQFDNIANQQAHYEMTGPEIWEDTNGKVDAIVFGTGTGGTLCGTGRFLKEKRSSIRCVLADPEGSVLYNYFKHSKLERKGDGSITEGIGTSRVTKNVAMAPVDDALYIPESEVIYMTFKLLHDDGFFVGASSGLNIAAAVQLSKQLGPNHTIVTCLCDSGQRYTAKLFSRKVLEERKLLEFIPAKWRHSLHDR